MLSFKLKKQTSKNVVDTIFQIHFKWKKALQGNEKEFSMTVETFTNPSFRHFFFKKGKNTNHYFENTILFKDLSKKIKVLHIYNFVQVNFSNSPMIPLLFLDALNSPVLKTYNGLFITQKQSFGGVL